MIIPQRGIRKAMNDKTLHVIMLGMMLLAAVILIIFAHQWLSPDVVFSSMIAGLSGMVGARIASNGYDKDKEKKP